MTLKLLCLISSEIWLLFLHKCIQQPAQDICTVENQWGLLVDILQCWSGTSEAYGEGRKIPLDSLSQTSHESLQDAPLGLSSLQLSN